jgi:hypothetical protein
MEMGRWFYQEFLRNGSPSQTRLPAGMPRTRILAFILAPTKVKALRNRCGEHEVSLTKFS